MQQLLQNLMKSAESMGLKLDLSKLDVSSLMNNLGSVDSLKNELMTQLTSKMGVSGDMVHSIMSKVDLTHVDLGALKNMDMGKVTSMLGNMGGIATGLGSIGGLGAMMGGMTHMMDKKEEVVAEAPVDTVEEMASLEAPVESLELESAEMVEEMVPTETSVEAEPTMDVAQEEVMVDEMMQPSEPAIVEESPTTTEEVMVDSNIETPELPLSMEMPKPSDSANMLNTADELMNKMGMDINDDQKKMVEGVVETVKGHQEAGMGIFNKIKDMFSGK